MAPRFFPAIASQSLGRAPHHDIETKLDLIAAAGFHAIELFMEDLELVATRMRSAASTLPPSTTTTTNTPNASSQLTPLSSSFTTTSSNDDDSLLAAAHHISRLCHNHNLTILCLQPFANYEGLLSPTAHASRLSELTLWLRLARALNTDLIQIPSSYLPPSLCTGDRARVIADLRAAADLGQEQAALDGGRPVRFAHEALAWATHADRWTQVWEIVREVDRENFGTCLDTFNLLGREYADPAVPGGLVGGAEGVLAETLHKLRSLLQEDISKVFYVEACDGERLTAPLVAGHPFYDASQPARMSWSRNARLFPCEEAEGERGAGYLPVCETLQAIVDAGYEGYVSFEFFSRTAHEVGSHVPREHAARAKRSWARLCERMGWEDCMLLQQRQKQQQVQVQQEGLTVAPGPAHVPRLVAPLQAH